MFQLIGIGYCICCVITLILALVFDKRPKDDPWCDYICFLVLATLGGPGSLAAFLLVKGWKDDRSYYPDL